MTEGLRQGGGGVESECRLQGECGWRGTEAFPLPPPGALRACGCPVPTGKANFESRTSYKNNALVIQQEQRLGDALIGS